MIERRVAVLVDGDNVSARHSHRIRSAAGDLGRIDVARVYAAADHLPGWVGTSGYRPMYSGAGKNATDLLLSIDAMELALVGGLEAFVIATSDRDYTHLAERLRERGSHVLGIGEAKAPQDFRQACTGFLSLPCATAAAPAVSVTPVTTVTPVAASELDRKIREVIAQYSTKGLGIRLVELGARMHTAYGIRISKYPEGNWRGYLSARPTLYEIGVPGQDSMVRFLPRGFA